MLLLEKIIPPVRLRRLLPVIGDGVIDRLAVTYRLIKGYEMEIVSIKYNDQIIENEYFGNSSIKFKVTV